jgi:predicted SAM-dependent methyltransferase
MTSTPPQREPLRLHLGGVERREGWKVLNALPGPAVDFVGTCDDLSQFKDGSVDEVYASHIFEHLAYFDELPKTLSEVARVVRLGGVLSISVPDLNVLCRMMLSPQLSLQERFHVMRMLYGGQSDQFDFHKVGYTFELLQAMLMSYCFGAVTKVESFGLFKDTSEYRFNNEPISLNVRAVRQAGTPPKVAPWAPVD